MATIKEEIMSIAEAQGYEGKSSGTIAEAVNALGSVMGDYELPAATATTLGGIKVGDGLAVESDGTLSASGGGGGAIATFPLEYNGMAYTAGEFFSGEYAGETATNEKIHELVTKGVVVAGIVIDSYTGSYSYNYINTSQKSGSDYTIHLVSLYLNGDPGSETVFVSRLRNSNKAASGVSYVTNGKTIN